MEILTDLFEGVVNCNSELQAFPFPNEKIFLEDAEIQNSAIISEFSNYLYALNLRYLKKNFHKTNISMAPWQR